LKCQEGQTVEPIVEVEVLEKKKYTKPKEKCGPAATVTWNEHLFFEPKNTVCSDQLIL